GHIGGSNGANQLRVDRRGAPGGDVVATAQKQLTHFRVNLWIAQLQTALSPGVHEGLEDRHRPLVGARSFTGRERLNLLPLVQLNDLILSRLLHRVRGGASEKTAERSRSGANKNPTRRPTFLEFRAH